MSYCWWGSLKMLNGAGTEGTPKMADDNFGPWIEWAGGECPIPDAKAGEWEIIWRHDGMEKGNCAAVEMRWSNDTEWFNIIARAIAEADKAATERERERCAKIADAKWASLMESADKAFESDNAQHAASAVGLNARADDMKSLAAAIRGAGQ